MTIFDDYKGKYVIIRSVQSGVHAGVLQKLDGSTVELQSSRRLWYWVCKKGHSLTGVALHGIDQSKSKIAGELSEHLVLGVCEIIPVTDSEAQDSIVSAPEHLGEG